MQLDFHRQALALVSLMLVVLSSACSSEVSCKDACACEGLPGNKLCLDSCENSKSASEAKAKAASCGNEQSDFAMCAADNASCDSVKMQYSYLVDECKTESDKLAACFKAGSTSSSTGSN